jgi:Domain of unknown function (DUF4262)
MPDYVSKLPGFTFREPDDAGDEKLLGDIREHGWHVVGVPDDDEGPGFCFTVGVYLRTLQPEILLMGVTIDPTHRVLNAIAEYLMAGGTITPETRYPDFVDGREVLFRPIHQTQFHEYLGCANWFYRRSGIPFPASQCIWSDTLGRFPHEDGFDSRFKDRQLDLSLPRS